MIALRWTIRPKDRKLTLMLPPDFTAEEVDIIVLPTHEWSERKGVRAAGSWKGKMRLSQDFDAPLLDFKDYTE